MIKLQVEKEDDLFEIEELLDLVFGPGRQELASYRFREGVKPVHKLSFTIRDEYNVIVGVIRFWPILLGTQKLPGLLLGPIGVHPIRQGEGLGGVLIRKSLKRAQYYGWERVVLFGDLGYYQRFGFSRGVVEKLEISYPVNKDRFIGHELRSGSLSGLSGRIEKWRERT